MAADLRQALARLDARPGAVLAGMYASADQPRCDVENRLLTNLGQRASRRAWPVSGSSAASVCPAPAPVPVARAHGHLYYYRYQLTAPGNRGSLPDCWPGGTG